MAHFGSSFFTLPDRSYGLAGGPGAGHPVCFSRAAVLRDGHAIYEQSLKAG
jgi:hypothetical protein